MTMLSSSKTCLRSYWTPPWAIPTMRYYASTFPISNNDHKRHTSHKLPRNSNNNKMHISPKLQFSQCSAARVALPRSNNKHKMHISHKLQFPQCSAALAALSKGNNNHKINYRGKRTPTFTYFWWLYLLLLVILGKKVALYSKWCSNREWLSVTADRVIIFFD